MGRGLGGQALVTGKGRPRREGVKAEGLAPGWPVIPEGGGGVCFPELGTELRTQLTGPRAQKMSLAGTAAPGRWRAWKETLV